MITCSYQSSLTPWSIAIDGSFQSLLILRFISIRSSYESFMIPQSNKNVIINVLRPGALIRAKYFLNWLPDLSILGAPLRAQWLPNWPSVIAIGSSHQSFLSLWSTNRLLVVEGHYQSSLYLHGISSRKQYLPFILFSFIYYFQNYLVSKASIAMVIVSQPKFYHIKQLLKIHRPWILSYLVEDTSPLNIILFGWVVLDVLLKRSGTHKCLYPQNLRVWLA